MAEDTQSKFNKEFTLKVALGFEEGEGLDFGTKALMDALVDDHMSKYPDVSREVAFGELLDSAIFRFADEVFGEEKTDEIYADAQAAARKKYDVYPPWKLKR